MQGSTRSSGVVGRSWGGPGGEKRNMQWETDQMGELKQALRILQSQEERNRKRKSNFMRVWSYPGHWRAPGREWLHKWELMLTKKIIFISWGKKVFKSSWLWKMAFWYWNLICNTTRPMSDPFPNPHLLLFIYLVVTPWKKRVNTRVSFFKSQQLWTVQARFVLWWCRMALVVS